VGSRTVNSLTFDELIAAEISSTTLAEIGTVIILLTLPSFGDWAVRRRVVVDLALAIVVVVAGVSCSSTTGSSDETKLSVVAGFYPLAEAASQVGGDLVDVENLTPPGVEPHDLELTPQEIADIQEADVVLYLGEGFAPAIEAAVADAQGVTVDLLNGMPLQPGEPEEREEGPVTDPHVWLDPVLYRELVNRVEAVLARARPEDASTYEANARSFDAELAALDDEYRRGLTGCARDVIVTSHGAFGYLAAQYGLTQEPIAGLSPDAEPSAQRLADLAALVRREGVTTIFTEELVSHKVAETLADETGVTTAVLNPLEGLTSQQLAAGEDYVSVMKSNLAILEKALGCPAS
jgi:zinc transport system substrate-binding protein